MLSKKIFTCDYVALCDRTGCQEQSFCSNINSKNKAIELFKSKGWGFWKGDFFSVKCCCPDCRAQLNESLDRLEKIREKIVIEES